MLARKLKYFAFVFIFCFDDIIVRIFKKNLWLCIFPFFFVPLQQFGKILDVEIIFNERGSKVHMVLLY